MEDTENQNVKNRLIKFIMFKNISINKFETEVGFSQGYIKNISKSIQPDKMEKIAKVYPELNLGWLMTGEGEMLRGQVQNIGGHHNAATMNGDITQNYAPLSEDCRIDTLLQSNQELIRQHGEIIRQQGELIAMLKVVMDKKQ